MLAARATRISVSPTMKVAAEAMALKAKGIDGTVYYGTYTRYNYSQGHLVRFSAAGAFMSAYPFGWDITPAIWPHGGTFSVITKENRYVGIGSYCGGCASNRIASTPQGYYITQLSPSLQQEWQLKATNTQSCVRQANGSVTCSRTVSVRRSITCS